MLSVVPTVTFAIAVIGAVLGILNTWNGINDRRVRLRVAPGWSLAPGWHGLTITVTNLSSFPVTLNEVGFTLSRSRGPFPRRILVTLDRVAQGLPLPTRLDRRESYTVIFDATGIAELKPLAAYALTGCGTLRRGSSDALRQFRNEGLRALG